MDSERPRGTRDFTPEDMSKRAFVEKALRNVASRFNYGEVLFPAFEHTQLFQTKSGEEIAGHMYVFEDKSGRSLCLRPEATASVARMFGTSLRNRHKPVKVFYFGPMYRYEEPQKNRYREFWQFGFELIGSDSKESDAETILLAVECLRALNIDYSLEISHLGVARALLEETGLDEKQQDHIIACLDRKNTGEVKKTLKDGNLLKLMELKGNMEAIEKAKEITGQNQKANDALGRLEEVAELLDSARVQYSVNLGIARGLAYYTGIIFEIRVQNLGAQNQICGGGRYDNLIKMFSGLDEPAVGFAFGFDRLLDAAETQKVSMPEEEKPIVVSPASEDARDKAFEIAAYLRRITARRIELDLMNRKLGRNLEHASNINASFVVIVGLKELKENKVILKDMQQSTQKEVNLEEIAKILL